MLPGGQVRVFLEMLRPQRLADRVLLVEPFAQVNEFAAMRAKGPIGALEPVAFLFACGTFNFWQRVHGCAQHSSSALYNHKRRLCPASRTRNLTLTLRSSIKSRSKIRIKTGVIPATRFMETQTFSGQTKKFRASFTSARWLICFL